MSSEPKHIVSRRLKIILLGDAAVGKTKLMQRFLVDGFNPRRLPTHAVNIFPYSATVEGRNWDIDFWDTAGQDKFNHVHSSYYADVHCCIIVFDVTRKLTYKNLKKWHQELRNQDPKTPIVCVANKIDADMAVTNREFSFCTQNDICLYFVSASTGVNVVRAFNEAIKFAISHQEQSKKYDLRRLVEERYN